MKLRIRENEKQDVRQEFTSEYDASKYQRKLIAQGITAWIYPHYNSKTQQATFVVDYYKGLGEKTMIIRERNKRPIKENAQSEFDKRLRDANRWYVKAFNDYENGALDNGGYLYYEVDGPYYGYEDDDNFIFILTMEDGYVDEQGNPIYAPELSVRVNKGKYFKDDNPIIDSTAAYYGDTTESQAMIDSIYAYLNDKRKKYRGSNDNIPW